MTFGRTESRIELRGLPTGASVRAAVAVLNGATPSALQRSRALARRFAPEILLVAVDGGLRTCLEAGERPDLLVGDGDSAGSVPDGIPALRFPTDKEFSDLAAALEALRERRVDVVSIAGLVGGRLDHEWANLLELGRHAPHFAGLLASTERGTLLVTGHGCRAATDPGCTISMFSLGAAATVTLLGTRWEVRRRRIPPGSLGLSNRCGTELDLTVHAGVALLIWPADGD